MKQTTTKQLYRQGDVLFVPVRKIKSAANAKKRDNGTVAYGEVTGHSHTVMSSETAEVLECGEGITVVVSDRGVAIAGDLARVMPDLEAIANDPSESGLRRRAASNACALAPFAGAVFLHGSETERLSRPVPSREEDRHLPVLLLPGQHKVRIQKEYAPEAIRNVTD